MRGRQRRTALTARFIQPQRNVIETADRRGRPCGIEAAVQIAADKASRARARLVGDADDGVCVVGVGARGEDLTVELERRERPRQLDASALVVDRGKGAGVVLADLVRHLDLGVACKIGELRRSLVGKVAHGAAKIGGSAVRLSNHRHVASDPLRLEPAALLVVQISHAAAGVKSRVRLIHADRRVTDLQILQRCRRAAGKAPHQRPRIRAVIGGRFCNRDRGIHQLQIAERRIAAAAKQSCHTADLAARLIAVRGGHAQTADRLVPTVKVALKGAVAVPDRRPGKTTEVNVGGQSQILPDKSRPGVDLLCKERQLLPVLDPIGIGRRSAASGKRRGNASVPNRNTRCGLPRRLRGRRRRLRTFGRLRAPGRLQGRLLPRLCGIGLGWRLSVGRTANRKAQASNQQKQSKLFHFSSCSNTYSRIISSTTGRRRTRSGHAMPKKSEPRALFGYVIIIAHPRRKVKRTRKKNARVRSLSSQNKTNG